MGRLPDSFAGRKITARVPYVMEGVIRAIGNPTLAIPTPRQEIIPPSQLTHNVDRPFEIHRMIPRAYTVTSSAFAFSGDLGMFGLSLFALQIFDFTKNQELLRTPPLAASLVAGQHQRAWEWADPYYLEPSEGFTVTAQTTTMAISTFFASLPLRIQVSFEGFLVNVAPASDRRG